MHIRFSVASLYRQDACGRRRPWHKTRVANIKLRGKSRKCASYEWRSAASGGQFVYGAILLEGWPPFRNAWLILHSSYDWSFSQSVAPPGGYGAGGEDRTDVRLYGDVFAGLAYDVSDSFKLFAGVRYIIMDDMNRKIDVTGVSDYSAGINHDVLIELGARYRF
jgi:hypothetical protein